ncbi:MAG: lanthionine synthetase C family protein [Polyangiales bacterium]
MRAWHPILEGGEAARAREVVDAIATALRGKLAEPASPLLDASHALFFSALGGRDGAETAVAFLERAMEGVATEDLGPGLMTGFTGVACAVSLLTGRVLAAPTSVEEDPCAAIDEALEELLTSAPVSTDEPYDLISGLVGIGVYALERADRPAGRRCVRAVIERLARLAVLRPDGAAWVTPPCAFGVPRPVGTLDLGVAHGVGGVIALLGDACAKGFDEARPLLAEAVSFLLAQELPRGGSLFPGALMPGLPQRSVRAGWCYGDPGLAAALMVAARGANVPAWEASAVRIARPAALRSDEESGVTDAAICHGAAGLGHLFNRVYQATGDATCGAAARRWMLRAIDLRDVRVGVAGYRAHIVGPDGVDTFEDDASLIRGVTGIGLALLGAIEDVEPTWDRMIASAPRPARGAIEARRGRSASTTTHAKRC